MSLDKTIYFFGSLPPKGLAPFGGGEVGNLRTVRMLRSFGYEVRCVSKRRTKASASKWKMLLSYPFRVGVAVVKFFFLLAFGKRQAIVHVAGFYGSTIGTEVVVMRMAKLFGYQTVYELRGGGAVKYYEEGTKRYRRQFAYLVRKADMLFSQGMENKPLLDSLCNTPFFYYPNCVTDDFLPLELPKKSVDNLNLLFFGRLEKEKNILLIVEVTAVLQKRFENVTLTLIGNGQKEYLDEVRHALKCSLKEGSYTLLPGCKHEELKQHLTDKHFYVFPSMQEREGHSNALTEAMAYGIIPIASPQGFSRTVTGDERLIVDEYSAKAYAKRIETIVSEGEMDKLGAFVYQRVCDNYTETALAASLRRVYDAVFDSGQ